VQFYQSRYFGIVLWVLPVLAAAGLTRLTPRIRAVLLLPVALATAYLTVDTVQAQRAQERGIAVMHIAAARYVSEHVPHARVLGVEGAGTLRFLTPRSLEVIDLMGLNNRHIAHLGDSFARSLCYLRARHVTHIAYPAQWQRSIGLSFELRTLARFTEPAYAQMSPPQPWQLTLAEVLGDKPAFAQFCDSTTSAP
jgi:hypothetical protein